MKPRSDVVGLVTGLIAIAVAALGLWGAFGRIDWSLVAILAPASLITAGVAGLLASRPQP